MIGIKRLVGTGIVTAGTLLAPLGVVGFADAAHASGGSGVVQRGTCTDGSAWKLKAKADNGRIEVEWEVDTNHVGQVWTARLRDNGDTFFKGTRTTQGASGSFTVHDTTGNRAGADTIRARSTYAGAVCRGSVTF